MNLQRYCIHYEQRIEDDKSTTSYTQTLSMIAQKRMQHIWITFIDGVKSLYDFAVCFDKSRFEPQRLQELSQNAQEKINLAEQDIDSGENDIKAEIYRLILQRQKYEQDMEDLNSKIISLSQMAIIKQIEVQTATGHVKHAESEVKIQTKKENQAQENAQAAVGGTIVASVLAVATGGILTIGVAVAGVFTTIATQSALQDAKTALAEKRNVLELRRNDLRDIEIKLNRIQGEHNENKIEFNNLEVRHEELLNESKLLTKLKSCISQCHDYINITLGSVEILNERRKVEISRGNLKQIIENIVEQLLGAQSLEGHFPIMQQLKSLTLEMQSKCIEPILNAKQTKDDMKTSCYTKCCSFSYCCIGIFFSSIRCLFCCFRSFRL